MFIYFRHLIENRLSTWLNSPADGMTTDDLYYKWNAKKGSDLDSAVAIGDELIMSQFAVDGSSVDEITASYVTGTGNSHISFCQNRDMNFSF